MRIYVVLLLTAAPASAAGVEEVRAADGSETITLRADGTAERHYRGRWDKVRLDEPVGWFTAKLDPRDFRRWPPCPGPRGSTS